MSVNDLNRQVDAFHEWKQGLALAIEQYKNWLVESDLYSDELEHRLQRGVSLLNDEKLTVALVGEYSRGKTELINALLCTGYGQRMLPSQAGRTTMCPTEIFYDQTLKRSYLKLLPIESRAQNYSINELKSQDQVWKTFPINVNREEELIQTLKQIAETRVVSFEEARRLGFDEASLERAANSDQVMIPAWRHAMLSIENPVLQKGLCILDTPGLNALGSEPELTISMIPSAQAIIFMLSADTGVTASDMAIWKQYVDTDRADHRAGRFAVLNKIDVLWDDLQGETHIASSIEHIRHLTAKQLNMDVEDVIPLSAKQGLIAKVKKDHALLQRSAFQKLEKLISKRILSQREETIYRDLIRDVRKMIQGSQTVLNNRLTSLYDRHDELGKNVHNQDSLKRLANQTQAEHEEYYRKLITLKSSKRLMESQGEILQQLVSEDRLKDIMKQTRREMQDCWSTVGMVHAIYQRFKSDMHAKYLKPKPFVIEEQRLALQSLKSKLIKFCRRPKMFMTEQSVLINHFFNTFAAEVRLIQIQIIKRAKQWPEDALLPLMQYAHEQKSTLEKQVAQLRNLASSSKDVKSQQAKLKDEIDRAHKALHEAEAIQQALDVAPPSNVINIQDIANR